MKPMTEELLLERISALQKDGLTVYRADDHERGMFGIIVQNPGYKEALEEFPMFGNGPLIPERKVVSALELVDFARQGGDLKICDDPMSRLWGLGRYDLERGVTVVRQTTLYSLKENTNALAYLKALRKKLDPSGE
jgi:hypothetical protein